MKKKKSGWDTLPSKKTALEEEKKAHDKKWKQRHAEEKRQKALYLEKKGKQASGEDEGMQ